MSCKLARILSPVWLCLTLSGSLNCGGGSEPAQKPDPTTQSLAAAMTTAAEEAPVVVEALPVWPLEPIQTVEAAQSADLTAYYAFVEEGATPMLAVERWDLAPEERTGLRCMRSAGQEDASELLVEIKKVRCLSSSRLTAPVAMTLLTMDGHFALPAPKHAKVWKRGQGEVFAHLYPLPQLSEPARRGPLLVVPTSTVMATTRLYEGAEVGTVRGLGRLLEPQVRQRVGAQIGARTSAPVGQQAAQALNTERDLHMVLGDFAPGAEVLVSYAYTHDTSGSPVASGLIFMDKDGKQQREVQLGSPHDGSVYLRLEGVLNAGRDVEAALVSAVTPAKERALFLLRPNGERMMQVTLTHHLR